MDFINPYQLLYVLSRKKARVTSLALSLQTLTLIKLNQVHIQWRCITSDPA